MTSRRIVRLAAICAVALLLRSSVFAEDTALLVERLHRANAVNSIDDLQMKPWHLKLSFQLFDGKGVAIEAGTIEEWWGGPSTYKIVYTSPSYTATEIRLKDDLYRSRGLSSAPDVLQLALRQVVDPMPTEEEISASKPYLQKETFGKVSMDCIMLAQEIKHVAFPPLGLFPTYCFDRDKDSLRVTYDFGSQLVLRNSIGTFAKRTVALDQTISLGSVKAITAHVDELRTMPLNDGDFATSQDLEKLSTRAENVSSGVAQGLALSQPTPIYPERAKANHVAGKVLIGATIGRDGRVHSMKIISTPDADLAIAALAAVRQWRYKPYLLNGEPVEVRTQMTVNFNMSR
jgi:TonB family protein